MVEDILPTFFILGAAKAGTTTLYYLLRQHPQVFLPFRKEPMFFSSDECYTRGVAWYARTYFRGAQSYLARGEATPHYLYWAEKVAPRMKEVYGEREPKFIVALRDPVERAYSWYWNMVREGNESLPFEEALEREAERIKAAKESLQRQGSMRYGYYWGGCYASQLEVFLEYFSPGSFHFVFQEDMRRSLALILARVHAFLGVEHIAPRGNVRGNPASLPRSRLLLRWLRRRSVWKDLLKPLIPFRVRHFLKTAVIRLNLRTVTYPPMDRTTEKALRARYEDEIRRLERIVGRDLTAWRRS
jgi:hypothetical protein